MMYSLRTLLDTLIEHSSTKHPEYIRGLKDALALVENILDEPRDGDDKSKT